MQWSNRDKKIAARHISPGAKVGIFLVSILMIAVIGFVGWTMAKKYLPDLGGGSGPSEIIAGETFEPGAEVDWNGTKTKAVLDGVSQKVTAENPTAEWKEALKDVACDKAGVCTASAPQNTGGGEGGLSGLAKVGGIGGLVGAVFVGWVFYVIITEEK